MRNSCLLLCALLVMSIGVTLAAVPQQINYQGCLADTSGNPITGNRGLIFVIYSDSVGGSWLWIETHTAVQVTDGLFRVTLGGSQPLPDNLFNGRVLWLQTTVEMEPMLPRMRLVTVPYSYRAVETDHSIYADTSDYTPEANHAMYSDTSDYANEGNHAVYSDTSDYSLIGAPDNDWVISGDDIYRTTGNVGIGTSAPGCKLRVIGQVISGEYSSAQGQYCAINGGYSNLAGNTCATVGGGKYNRANGLYSVIAGGGGASAHDSNSASGEYSVISGGRSNIASVLGATVGGGRNNIASGILTTVGGGAQNTASGMVATLLGGYLNSANGGYASVGGGYINTADGGCATVGGGTYNTSTSYCATISGGSGNDADGDFGTVGGGNENSANGYASTVPGGDNNAALARYAFAAGRNARATTIGSFVWADSNTTNFYSVGHNSFCVRASGGVRFATTSSGTVGVKLDAGDTAWEVLSDSTKKTILHQANTQEILNKVAALPIAEWYYKHQSPNDKHIGPMAQDFHALFGYGDDNLSISTIDPDGIALAAIQQLIKENQELKQRIEKLEAMQR